MSIDKPSTTDVYGAAAPWIDLGLRAWDFTLASAQAGPQHWQQWMDSVNTFMVVASRPSNAPLRPAPAGKRPVRVRAPASKRRVAR